MFPTTFLLTTLLLALSTVASPLEVRSSGVTLPLAKRIYQDGAALNLLKRDQARAATMRARADSLYNGKLGRRADGIVADVAYGATVGYVASIGVGTPPTQYDLIVATGGSNTFVGGSKPYQNTSSSVRVGEPMLVSWLSYNYTGEEWLDTVTVAPGLVVREQAITVIGKNNTLNGTDGLLGLGPILATNSTLLNHPTELVPTVTDNLFKQGAVHKDVFSISFAPTATYHDDNGEIMFGGIDASKHTSKINYVPITSIFPSSVYWGFNQSVSYGNTTIMPDTTGITDTSCYLTLLPSNALSEYMSLTGAVLDEKLNLLTLTLEQYDKLENLYFHIGSETYSLVPNAQIWPRALNNYLGGSSSAIYSIINSVGTSSGTGYDFINGMTFLERVYSVYDNANHRVGFARTEYTDVIVN